MTQQELPSALNNILESSQKPDALFSALLPAIGDFLQSDRCFLYLHNPQNNLGRVAFCWIRTPDVPTVYNEDWAAQPPSVTDEDPMFAAALRAEPSIFVEDVETADSQVLNREFEQKNFWTSCPYSCPYSTRFATLGNFTTLHFWSSENLD